MVLVFDLYMFFPDMHACVCTCVSRRVAMEMLMPLVTSQLAVFRAPTQQLLNSIKAQPGDTPAAAQAVLDSLKPKYDSFTDYEDIVRDIG